MSLSALTVPSIIPTRYLFSLAHRPAQGHVFDPRGGYIVRINVRSLDSFMRSFLPKIAPKLPSQSSSPEANPTVLVDYCLESRSGKNDRTL